MTLMFASIVRCKIDRAVEAQLTIREGRAYEGTCVTVITLIPVIAVDGVLYR